jgi:hypothetical protein
MLHMSRTRALGLAVVAVFASGALAAASASAANNWEEEVSAGKWEVIKVAKTAKAKGTLKLKDTKTALGETEVECEGAGKGTVGPNGKDTLTEIAATKCIPKKVCTSEVTAEAINIAPKTLGAEWQTALEELEGEIRDKITTTSGTKEVGWIVQCKAGNFGKVIDECKQPSTTTKVINEANGTVKVEFDKKSPKSNCTKGGSGSGEILGPITFEVESGGKKVNIRVK